MGQTTLVDFAPSLPQQSK